MTATCRYCGAPIRWVQNATGRWLPLNPDPTPLGNIVLDAADRTGGHGSPDLTRRYQRHFCQEYEARRS